MNIIPLVVFGAVLVGIIIIGLILSPYHIYTEVDGELNKLQKRLNIRPSIEVRPVREHDIYCLEVKNIGNAGVFMAEIQIIEGGGHITPYGFNRYKACWESVKGRESQIFQDQTDRIKIAHLVSYSPLYQSQHLDLYYYNPQTNQENHVNSDTYWVGATLTSENGKERPLTSPEFILQVTINAKEGLREGSFAKKYKLGFSGLEEMQG